MASPPCSTANQTCPIRWSKRSPANTNSKCLEPPIPKSVRVAEAPAVGKSVLTYAPLLKAGRRLPGFGANYSGATMTDGKRALFEEPRTCQPARRSEKSHCSLTTRRHRREITIACSRCDETTRVDCLEAVARIAWFSVWIPGKPSSRWVLCPACHQRAWVKVRWFDS